MATWKYEGSYISITDENVVHFWFVVYKLGKIISHLQLPALFVLEKWVMRGKKTGDVLSSV